MKSIFDKHDTNGIQLLSHLILNLSDLNESKFRHDFKDTVDPMCTCGLEPEATLHYLLYHKLYSTLRLELLKNVFIINPFPKN